MRTSRAALYSAASQALLWSTVLTAIAALGLSLALARGDLTLRYVAEQIILSAPLASRVTALWTGAAGQRLVFALLLGVGATVAVRSASLAQARGWSPVALALALALALGYCALGLPFARLPWLPTEGRGTALRFATVAAQAMVPPLLLGYALLFVAAALALDKTQRPRVRRWLLGAWLAQTTALSLGAWTLDRGPMLVTGPFISASTWAAVVLWVATSLVLLLPRVRSRSARAVVATFALGVACATAGGVARLFTKTYEVSLGQGESTTLRDAFGRDWTFTQQGISVYRASNREVTAVTLEASRRDEIGTALLVSERSQFVDSDGEEVGEPMVQPEVRSGLLQDAAATLTRLTPNNHADVRVEFRPLGAWIWAGCVLLVAGGVAACIAGQRRDC